MEQNELSDVQLNPNSTARLQAEAETFAAEQGSEACATQPDPMESYTPDYSAEIQTIREQAQELGELYPNLDIGDEMERDPFMAQMLARGYSLRSVYELKYPGIAEERLMNAKKEEVLMNIRARNAKPQPMGYAGSYDVKRDVHNMSDQEIMEIDAKIRRGLRVTL